MRVRVRIIIVAVATTLLPKEREREKKYLSAAATVATTTFQHISSRDRSGGVYVGRGLLTVSRRRRYRFVPLLNKRPRVRWVNVFVCLLCFPARREIYTSNSGNCILDSGNVEKRYHTRVSVHYRWRWIDNNNTSCSWSLAEKTACVFVHNFDHVCKQYIYYVYQRFPTYIL